MIRLYVIASQGRTKLKNQIDVWGVRSMLDVWKICQSLGFRELCQHQPHSFTILGLFGLFHVVEKLQGFAWVAFTSCLFEFWCCCPVLPLYIWLVVECRQNILLPVLIYSDLCTQKNMNLGGCWLWCGKNINTLDWGLRNYSPSLLHQFSSSVVWGSRCAATGGL